MTSKALNLLDNIIASLKPTSESKEEPQPEYQPPVKSGPYEFRVLTPKDVKVDANAIRDFVNKSWDESVLSTIEEYIKIPNQSPDYDSEIYTNGYQEQALKLLVNWINNHKVKGMNMEVLTEKEKTPFIFIEVDAFNTECKDTVLMYGHFDKQPPLTNDWSDGLDPYKPVIRDGKLYGRGGADDGYSTFAAIDSIRALQAQNASHPRIVITIEGSEESGSPHLDFYLEKLSKRIGEPSVVICLDSGCGNYDQLWLTSSLRGIVIGFLKCQLLEEGIHSGGSGLVRDSFHVLRSVLNRFDDPITGVCKIPELNSKIPQSHRHYASEMGAQVGEKVWTDLPLCKNVEPQLKAKTENITELLLNSTWRPQLSITGIDGMPNLKGGNVLRKYTTLKLSIRLPPNLNPEYATKIIKQRLEENPPFNSRIEFECKGHWGEGFCCPEFDDWLLDTVQIASQTYFDGKKCLMLGEGGSIPLMGQLQRNFPKAQFVVTGVLGPNSNAHGPNEFLHIEFTKRVIMSMANVLNASCNPIPNKQSMEQREKVGQSRSETKTLPKDLQ